MKRPRCIGGALVVAVVLAVAAVDDETAERALALIEVEFEELPAVFDPVSAMAPGAPVIHPEKPRYAGNINTRVDWHFGDVAKGFAEADLVREEHFVGNRTYQSPMEPHAAGPESPGKKEHGLSCGKSIAPSSRALASAWP